MPLGRLLLFHILLPDGVPPSDIIRKDGMMLQQHAVLTISNQRALRYLIEGVCWGTDVETVMVASGYEAQAMAGQGGLHAFAAFCVY